MECADGREEEEVETNAAHERGLNSRFRSPGGGDKQDYQQERQRNCSRINMNAENFKNRSGGGNDNDGYDVSEDLFTHCCIPHAPIVRPPAATWTTRITSTPLPPYSWITGATRIKTNLSWIVAR